jgi:transcription factor WhiB
MLEPTVVWMQRGKCYGINADSVFFPASRKDSIEGKKFCTGCVVINQCRTYAIAHGSYGIWGGTSTADREKIDQMMVDVIRKMYIDSGLYENYFLDEEEQELVVEQLPVLLDPTAALVADLDAILARSRSLPSSYTAQNIA